jgi:hypothetical protein
MMEGTVLGVLCCRGKQLGNDKGKYRGNDRVKPDKYVLLEGNTGKLWTNERHVEMSEENVGK